MFEKYSKQGYEVIDTIGNYTIMKRPTMNDYCIGYKYDTNTGMWVQGFYMFEGLVDCIDFLQETNRI